jgi:hypothetical protein
MGSLRDAACELACPQKSFMRWFQGKNGISTCKILQRLKVSRHTLEIVHIVVFWVMIPCTFVEEYKRFG